MPTIAIVIPTRNRPERLKQCLASIVKQSIAPDEVIVVDDGSSDQAAYSSVRKAWETMLPLRWERISPARGAPVARNVGATLAKSEWIAFLDDDDLLLPNRLSAQRALLNKNGSARLLYGACQVMDEASGALSVLQVTHTGSLLPRILDGCFVPSPTNLIHRRLFDEAGRYDRELVSCQDWDLWVRLGQLGVVCEGVSEPIATHRKHQLASIGRSRRWPLGYWQFYRKHRALFHQYGRGARCNEGLRWTAVHLLKNGHVTTAIAAATLSCVPPYAHRARR